MNLQELRELADAATSGWFIPDQDPLEVWTHEDERAIYVCKMGCSRSNADALADARFIAAARTAVPALLDALEEARGLLTRAYERGGTALTNMDRIRIEAWLDRLAASFGVPEEPK